MEYHIKDYEANTWDVVGSVCELISNQDDENFTILAYMSIDKVIDEYTFISILFSYVDEKYTNGSSKRLLSSYTTHDLSDFIAMGLAALIVSVSQLKSKSSHTPYNIVDEDMTLSKLVHSLYCFQVGQNKNGDWKEVDFTRAVYFMKDWLINEEFKCDHDTPLAASK